MYIHARGHAHLPAGTNSRSPKSAICAITLKISFRTNIAAKAYSKIGQLCAWNQQTKRSSELWNPLDQAVGG